MITGIEHTAIASPDPQRLAEWYERILGFKINYNSGRTYFVKAPNGYMLEIISAEGERGFDGMRAPGLRHLAIAVDDLDSAYRDLQDSEVKFLTKPEEMKGNKVVFFTDPDGNILHLLQRGVPLP